MYWLTLQLEGAVVSAEQSKDGLEVFRVVLKSERGPPKGVSVGSLVCVRSCCPLSSQAREVAAVPPALGEQLSEIA